MKFSACHCFTQFNSPAYNALFIINRVSPKHFRPRICFRLLDVYGIMNRLNSLRNMPYEHLQMIRASQTKIQGKQLVPVMMVMAALVGFGL